MAGKKILVADDSLTIQKVIRLALSNEGYDIQAVSDGNDAIQQISVFQPDLVLIDVSLPGKSAFEVKRAVNDLDDLAKIRFVLMSSAFEKVDEAQATGVGFDGRLTKPFDPAHLRQILADVLEKPTSSVSKFPADTIASVNTEWSSDLPGVSPDDTPIFDSPLQVTKPVTDLWGQESNKESYDIDLSPPPPPPPAMATESGHDSDIRRLTESTIRMSGLDDFQWSVKEPSLKPPASMLEMGDATFQIEPPSDRPPLPPKAPTAAIPSAPTSSSPLSQQELEETIRNQIRETLEKMAKSILPEVAERVIKDEIRRMLSEQP